LSEFENLPSATSCFSELYSCSLDLKEALAGWLGKLISEVFYSVSSLHLG